MIFRPARLSRSTLAAFLMTAALMLTASRIMVVKASGESMAPTLADGQWVVVIRGASRVHPGDVAVFISPLDGQLAVKRCVLEGGSVPVVDHGWLVTPWGRWYLTGYQWNRLDASGEVPAGSVYMVGDNQFRSFDSRDYGSIPRDRLVGRVWTPSLRRNHG